MLFKGSSIIEETFGDILDPNPIVSAMIIYVRWNLQIEMLKPIRFKVEDIKSDIPKNIHSKKHRLGYKLLTDKELKKSDPLWFNTVKYLGRRYGYENTI